MMIRAADQVASRINAGALVTGESLAQVSSQTLPNLSLIDETAEHLVIRPLIVMDKLDIIKIAANIGTEDFAKHMPEYCGVISDRPTSHAKKERIETEEANFDLAVLNKAVADSEAVSIDEVLDSVKTIHQVDIVKIPAVDDIIIDIRHPHEEESSAPNSKNTLLRNDINLFLIALIFQVGINLEARCLRRSELIFYLAGLSSRDAAAKSTWMYLRRPAE